MRNRKGANAMQTNDKQFKLKKKGERKKERVSERNREKAKDERQKKEFTTKHSCFAFLRNRI